jgi:hypothetical protein
VCGIVTFLSFAWTTAPGQALEGERTYMSISLWIRKRTSQLIPGGGCVEVDRSMEDPSVLLEFAISDWLAGTITARQALERCGSPEVYQDPVLGQAWHMLSHAANDTDDLERDADYRKWYEDTLRESLWRIRDQRKA